MVSRGAVHVFEEGSRLRLELEGRRPGGRVKGEINGWRRRGHKDK